MFFLRKRNTVGGVEVDTLINAGMAVYIRRTGRYVEVMLANAEDPIVFNYASEEEAMQVYEHLQGIMQKYGGGIFDLDKGEEEEAPEELYDSEDIVGEFIKECCETGAEYKTPGNSLYATFLKYAYERKDPGMKRITFTYIMKGYGYRYERTSKGMCFFGIRLKEKGEEE